MIYVVIWAICGLLAAAIYTNKGGAAGCTFIVGVLLGPLGLLHALLSSLGKAALAKELMVLVPTVAFLVLVAIKILNPDRHATYSVTEPAEAKVSITYHLPMAPSTEQRVQTREVRVPWSIPVTYLKNQLLSITVTNLGIGLVRCSIVLEGQSEPAVTDQGPTQAHCEMVGS